MVAVVTGVIIVTVVKAVPRVIDVTVGMVMTWLKLYMIVTLVTVVI